MRSGGFTSSTSSSSSTTGGGVLEQTLTAEAATVLKHSLTLARRRGHAHLTPLHVAATLLSSSRHRSSSLFRTACLNSPPPPPLTTSTTTTTTNHIPPLQCRALELCFNVALNRLPCTNSTPTAPPIHHHYYHHPSLSNALIAALKRAQAHQRRGSIEQQQQQHHHHPQQQPLLAIKVELESFIISILDDPSVSRVMREAGFSSTAVKTSLENYYYNTNTSSSSSTSTSSPLTYFHYYNHNNPSGGIFSSPSSPDHHHHHHHHLPSLSFIWPHNSNSNIHEYHQNSPFHLFSTPATSSTTAFVKEEDVKLVLEALLRNNNTVIMKRRNTVVVGDSDAITEGVVAELMRRFEKGEVPHQELKQTRFLKLLEFFSPVSSLRLMKRQDVENGLLELKTNLRQHHHHHQGSSVIIYTGDLKWTVHDDDQQHHDHHAVPKYSPVDHLVEEIAGLVNYSHDDDDDHIMNKKVWIMGSGSYQTYMRCQMRKPPLEIQWSLQAVSVPSSAGLGLTLNHQPPNLLNYSSVHESRIMFSSQDQSHQNNAVETKPSSFMLSSKLDCDDQQQNNKSNNDNNDKVVISLMCSECSSHFEKESQQLLLKSGHHNLPAWLQPHGTHHHQIMDDQVVELKKKWSRLCHSVHQGARHNDTSQIRAISSLLRKSYSSSSYPWWPTQSNNSILFQDSNSNISFADHPPRHAGLVPRFRRQQSSTTIEFNFGGSETRKHDQQAEVEPSELGKEVKITLGLGNISLFSNDKELGKVERGELCRVLKENVPWQSETIPSIVEAMMVSESATREITWLLIHGNDSIGKRRLACAVAESVLGSAHMLIHLKRKGDGNVGGRSQESEIEIITNALKSHKKIVVLVEDIDSADAQFVKFLSDGFETGKFGGQVNKKEANLGHAIFILTKEAEFGGPVSDVNNKESVVIQMTLNISTEAKTGVTGTNFEVLNLDRKRKVAVADWELPKKSKNLRTENKGFNDNVDLDLNVMAKGDREEEGEENKPGEVSPVSSDLTGETENVSNPGAFIESIENAFTFDRSPARDREMEQVFQGKMEKCFEEIISGDQINMVIRFRLEDRVLEEVCNGCGYFTNSLFEKWVKEVFEKAMKKVRFSTGKEQKGGLVVNVRLCLGGGNLEEGFILEDGFMGSCLPNKIQLFYKD